MKTLKVKEIFRSIEGEVCNTGQGRITTFIRLAVCNLRCRACDTPEAQSFASGTEMNIIDIVKECKTKKVTITGGEPLLQENVFDLTRELNVEKKIVSIETNGTIAAFGYGVNSFVVDYKLPSSGMEDRMNMFNFNGLRPRDFVKFVIGTELDLKRAIEVYRQLKDGRLCHAQFAFSPLNKINPDDTIIGHHYILRELEAQGINDFYLNIQVHKLLGLK